MRGKATSAAAHRRIHIGPRLLSAVDRRARDTRNIAILILLIFYGVINYTGLGTALGASDADAETVAFLSETVDEVGLFDSYGATAFIYGSLPEVARVALEGLVAIGFIFILLRSIRGMSALVLASFLCMSPIILFLSFFTKETILLVFLIAAYLSVRYSHNNMQRFLKVGAIYLVYGLLFRQYYLLITLMLGYLLMLRSASGASRIIIVALTAGALFAAPHEVYRALNDARDAVNYTRMGFGDEANRSAFMNLVESQGPISFLINYTYAAARLNLPLIFFIGIKELFLMVNVFSYFFLAGIGLYGGDEKTKFASLLFISHVAVLTLFEPDLGSYLRHTGTALIFLAPALVVLDRIFALRGMRSHSQAISPILTNRSVRPRW